MNPRACSRPSPPAAAPASSLTVACVSLLDRTPPPMTSTKAPLWGVLITLGSSALLWTLLITFATFLWRGLP
jgi:hypothetical protein